MATTPSGPHLRRVALALAVLLSGAGCGGGSAASTAPPPVVVAAVPAAPVGLAVGLLVMKDRTAALSWTAVSGAAEYVVEAGSAAGGTDVGIVSAGTATAFTLRDLRAGRSYVRVKARNSTGTSSASAEASFVLPDLGKYIEALFLGSGPLAFSQNISCPRPGMWTGFPRGTTVRNRASAQIPSQFRDAIRVILDQVPLATAGRLATTFEVVAEDAPVPADNQMTHVALRTAAELQFACGSTGGAACIAYNSPVERGGPFTGDVLRWSVGYYVVTNITSTRPYAHEPGHGLLGMCHINADVIGGSERSLMSAAVISGNQSERLTSFDIEALQAVYGSSIFVGARRADFVAAGLIR